MVIWIILLVLLVILSWLLFAPLIISINTWGQDFSIRWIGLGSVALVIVNNELGIRMRIFFFQKTFFPLRPKSKKRQQAQKPKPSKKTTRKKRQKWPNITWRRIRKLLRAIKIRRFKAELDTGDYVTNAYLYPLATFLNKSTPRLNVNFEGRTNLLLQLEMRLFRIVQAMVF